MKEGKERLEDEDVEEQREAASLLDSVFMWKLSPVETFSSVTIDLDQKVVVVKKEAD